MKKIIYIVIAVFTFVFNAKAQTELVSTGTGSAYVIAYPAAFSYSAGISVTFKAHSASTAGPITLNINGLGAKTIKKNVTTDLVLGDIKLNQYVTVMYDGTNFQMVTPSSAPGGFANTALSNLISTSVNQSLIPNATNTYSLGSNTMAWSDNYLAGKLYIAGAPWTSSAVNNTLIGTKGGEAFTTGLYNLGVGQGSGNAITTGYRNTVVGHGAGQNLNTQNDNTFVGNLAGGLATALGNDNTFLGSYAGYGTGNTGARNTFVGTNVGGSNTSGNNNTYVGQNAAYNATSGGFNTVIGSDAGQNLSTGTTNTFIGYNTGLANATQRSNASAIGYNATVDADNIVVLGNNADVAIGSPTSAKLTGSNRYLTLAAVQTGVSNGISALELVGNTASTNTVASKIDFLGLIPITNATSQRARIEAKSGAVQTLAGQLTFWTNNGTNATSIFERMRITESGNVGIGTSTPTAKLHVGGTSGVDGIRFPDGTLQTTAAIAGPWTSSGSYIYPTTLTDKVGIGTNTPSYTLDVFDNSANPGIFSRQNGAGYAIQGNNYGAGNGVVGMASTGNGVFARTTGTGAALYAEVQGAGTGPSALFMAGNVGVGTATPTNKLHLYSTANNGSDVMSETDAGRIVKHWFKNANRTWSIGQNGNTSAPNYSFSITDETAGSARLSITTTGNVGIGTSAPNSTLQVNGSVSVAIRNNNGATILTANDYFIILNVNGLITLPAASSCTGRVYVIKAPACCNGTTSINYINTTGTSVNTINSLNTYRLVSDGTNWQQW